MESVQLGLLLLSIPLQMVSTRMKFNTFPSNVFRSTPFSPRVIDKTCLLMPDPGPCRAEIPMYYYSPKEGNCTVFSWGGCQGNGNRFDSRKQCLNSCWSKPDQPKSRPKWCMLSFDYGFCFGEVKRWYYDHVWKVCKETIYSGCGGNKNNFYNREQCESICLYGNGMLDFFSKRAGKHTKVLIVNPEGATNGREREQPTTQQNNATTKKQST